MPDTLTIKTEKEKKNVSICTYHNCIDFYTIYTCCLGRNELNDFHVPLPVKSTGPENSIEVIPLLRISIEINPKN